VTERCTILASDFHLTPTNPAEIDVFVEFTRRVARGAERLLILGDLFEYWVGPHQLADPQYSRVFAACRDLAASGTEVVLFHGNRDFLLADQEARAAGGRVVGEECAFDLYGRRVLAMHGDSLCTRDIEYQKSKRILRGRFVRWLSQVMPAAPAHAIALRLRAKSGRSIARKTNFTMGIVDAEVERRLAEGFDAIVCGHVHQPESRTLSGGQLHVLGDWHGGGIYGRATRDSIALERFEVSPDRPARSTR
jgi:UDP-2,3-diacylglucosamine hydrolase